MRVIVALTLFGCVAAAPAPATTKSAPATTKSAPAGAPVRGGASTSRRDASDPAVAAVRAATLVLAKEYEQFLRSPGVGVRESANYFKDHPDESVTPEAVANAVAARGGGDPRTSAYVRWQLLSALPDDDVELDPAVARQLLTAYRNAPQPLPRPGMSPQEQQKLEALARGKKEGDAPDIRAELDIAVSQVSRQNGVILRYRDELYKRLPKTPDTFAAAMDDLMQRANAAADSKDLCKRLAGDVRAWAGAEMPPPQTMLVVARAARRLADTKGPQYYSSPYWRDHAFAWRKTRSGVASPDSLKDLAVFLEELATVPRLEVKDKEKRN